jgi:hypothetical protein
MLPLGKMDGQQLFFHNAKPQSEQSTTPRLT